MPREQAIADMEFGIVKLYLCRRDSVGGAQHVIHTMHRVGAAEGKQVTQVTATQRGPHALVHGREDIDKLNAITSLQPGKTHAPRAIPGCMRNCISAIPAVRLDATVTEDRGPLQEELRTRSVVPD